MNTIRRRCPPLPEQEFITDGVISTLFVSGMPDDVKKREVVNLFRFLPGFEHCILKTKPKHGPTAWVRFALPEQCERAIDFIRGQPFDLDEPERRMRAELAKRNTKRKRSRFEDDFPQNDQKRIRGGGGGGGGGFNLDNVLLPIVSTRDGLPPLGGRRDPVRPDMARPSYIDDRYPAEPGYINDRGVESRYMNDRGAAESRYMNDRGAERGYLNDRGAERGYMNDRGAERGYMNDRGAAERSYFDDWHPVFSRDRRARTVERGRPPAGRSYRADPYEERGRPAPKRHNPCLTPSSTLFVANLPFNINEDDVRNVFEGCTVVRASRNKGQAFVDFPDAAQAVRAREKMVGYVFATDKKRMPMRIEFAKKQMDSNRR
eukprot:767898_1